MDVSMISIRNEADVNKMLDYAQTNNFGIDLYVKHSTQEKGTSQTSNDIYDNVCPNEYEKNKSNDIGYFIDEIDDYEQGLGYFS